MVNNYEYEDYFYTGVHHKQLLFVEQDAIVTKDPGKPPVITKDGGDPIVITNENLITERFELSEAINSAENWAFGSIIPSMVTFDIRENGNIPILQGKTFRLYFYFDSNSSTLLYVGTYTFDEDKLSDDSKQRTISGFDMAQTIRDIDIIDWYRSMFDAHEEEDPEDPEQTIWVPGKEKIKVKEARDGLFYHLKYEEGLPLAQDLVTLPNDDFEFAFDVDTEAVSAGQFLEDICEINGVYGHFGRRLTSDFGLAVDQIFQYITIPRYDETGEKIGNSMRLSGIAKGLYETVSIERLRVYNRENALLAYYDEGYKKKYSKYNIYDNLLIDDLTKSKTTKSALKTMLKNIYDSIRYRKYVPFTAKTPANLCREVGDRITLWTDIDVVTEEGNTKRFKTLIFERKLSGIQNMVDTYSAKGDKKLPEFGNYSTSGGYSSNGGNKAGNSDKDKSSTDGEVELEGINVDDLIHYWRNVGIRLLDEPTGCLVKYTRNNNQQYVEIRWTDPEDVTSFEPTPAAWAGTVVVRSENKIPRDRWDGTTLIVNSIVRDYYKTNSFIDDTIETNKTYYYGIYPYWVKLDDNDHPVRFYTFTKIFKVTTYELLPKPVITSLVPDQNSMVVNYDIPSWSGGNYAAHRIIYKKNSVPLDPTDGQSQNISVSGNTMTISDLDEKSEYYFVIYVSDSEGNISASEPQNAKTGQIEAAVFNYTGTIQEYTVPKTGIYSLETWGAQGGNASDGTNTARGGYGSYAYGEVLLQQGDKLYIGVGGQHGYNGGGSNT